MLTGLQPLLVEGSAPAALQAACVMCLQLGMALVCFTVVPDADRVISTFAGTQFVFEGAATACLLVASNSKPDVLAASLNGTDTPSPADSVPAPAFAWPMASFWLGLLAIFVPMLQLVEQRL